MQPMNSPSLVFERERLDDRVRVLAEDRPIATFGLDSLNSLLGGGIYPGQHIVIGAVPGCGKTTLVLQEADWLASAGHAVLFVSAELPQHKLLEKSLARLSRGVLGLGEVAPAASGEDPRHGAFEAALDEYRERVAPNICITGPVSVTDIGCLVGECVRDRGEAPIVIVDYLQLLSTCGTPEPFVDERMAIAACVRGLRDISSRYGSPVIALSTITRTAYSAKRPSIGAFGGASAIEYGFDAALYLSEDDGSPGLPGEPWRGQAVLLSALKNRYGSQGVAGLVFDGEHATFHDRG